MREALERLGPEWLVFCNVRWLRPRDDPPDGELDFVLVHPTHGALILEAKGGAFALRDGGWWIVDRRGALRPLGRRGPFVQATDGKHELRRRLRSRCPQLATRMGHVVCFTSGAPDGDLGSDAPPEIVFTPHDFSKLEERLVAAAQILGCLGRNNRLPTGEVEAATHLLAPEVTVRRDFAREVATFWRRLDALATSRLQTHRATAGGTWADPHAQQGGDLWSGWHRQDRARCRRARELLSEGARVVVLCTSAQLVGFYRDALQGEWPGRLAVGRISLLLDPDAEVLAADAVLIDEAQNLGQRAHRSAPRALSKRLGDARALLRPRADSR